MNPNVEFFNELKSIITNNILDVSIEHIDNMYKIWYENKNVAGVKSNFVFSENQIHKKQNLPKEVVAKGIDLPSWFGNFKTNAKKIVVLGIDPLRSESSFNREHLDLEKKTSEKANFNKQVTIGTPYALHEMDTRQGGCIGYSSFVDELVKQDNFVYCTDIFKTYYYDKENNVRSYSDKKFVENKEHKNILDKELELIKPDLIIVFGKIAFKKLLGKNSPKIGQSISNTIETYIIKDKKIAVITVIHLSKGAYNSHMKTFLEANNIFDVNPSKRDDCAKAYVNIISEKLC